MEEGGRFRKDTDTREFVEAWIIEEDTNHIEQNEQDLNSNEMSETVVDPGSLHSDSEVTTRNIDKWIKRAHYVKTFILIIMTLASFSILVQQGSICILK